MSQSKWDDFECRREAVSAILLLMAVLSQRFGTDELQRAILPRFGGVPGLGQNER